MHMLLLCLQGACTSECRERLDCFLRGLVQANGDANEHWGWRWSRSQAFKVGGEHERGTCEWAWRKRKWQKETERQTERNKRGSEVTPGKNPIRDLPVWEQLFPHCSRMAQVGSYFNKFNAVCLWKTNTVKPLCELQRETGREIENSQCLGFPPLGITRWVHLLDCANRNRAGWREHNIDTVPSQRGGHCVCVLTVQRQVHTFSTFVSGKKVEKENS